MLVDHRAVWNHAFEEHPALYAKCPYDYIASFLFRFRPTDRAPEATTVCELGFGSGINLWFAARQGFQVAGVDVSDSAVETARELLAADGYSGDLQRASFAPLPFADGAFDLVFDRSALSYASTDDARLAVAEVARVLAPGGRFLFNPYSRAASAAGERAPETPGRSAWMPVAGKADVEFYDRAEVISVLGTGWRMLEMEHVVQIDEATIERTCRAQWRVVVEAR